MYNIPLMRKCILLLLILSLASCSWIPSWVPLIGSTDEGVDKAAADKKAADKKAAQEKAAEQEPQPGDVRVVDGVEYIYAKNRRYMLTPYEPMYVWIRKDQYSPGLFESLRTPAAGSTKEQKEMEDRIAKLEADLKKKGVAPQMGYPAQTMYLPQPGMGYPIQALPFNYPSPKMKRRVVILPLQDQTNYKNEHLGELATQRLISRLESTGTVISVDPATVGLTGGGLPEQQQMLALNETYGVQAIMNGALSDVYTSSQKVEGKDDAETSFALSRIALGVYNTDTGLLLKQVSGRNPVFLSREKGEMSPEKAKVRAIDLAIELIAEDLLRAILTLDWHARIASVEQDRVFLTAGRMSGLEKGDVLEIYTVGKHVVDSKTKASLGHTKGDFKGEVEVVELFGVDAAAAKLKGSSTVGTALLANFLAPGDLAYLKK
jgi:hypothetical protein